MKVVIDIGEKDLAMCIRREASLTASIAESCIANGTVLPKGHGDLIDRDVANKELGDIGISYGDDLLRYVPTVIPADK